MDPSDREAGNKSAQFGGQVGEFVGGPLSIVSGGRGGLGGVGHAGDRIGDLGSALGGG
jgi:hypothetical protein